MERDKFLRQLQTLLVDSIEERDKISNAFDHSRSLQNNDKQIKIIGDYHLCLVQRCATIEFFINSSIDKNEKQIEEILVSNLLYYQEQYIVESEKYESLFNAREQFVTKKEFENFKEQAIPIFNRRFLEAKSTYETFNLIKSTLDNENN